jgi:DNA-directed RNA polymerase II subunit RPB2
MPSKDISEDIWSTIDTFFRENKTCFVDHHLKSYNDFYHNGIFQIFKEKNPIKIRKNYNDKTEEFQFQCNLYLGGKDGSQIYIGKPIIYDKNYTHFMYPNEARLRNMTYGMTIHYDVFVEFIDNNPTLEEGKDTKYDTLELQKIFLGKFPIMINSDFCILKTMNKDLRYQIGECKNDMGGYFIVDGKEKLLIPQEKFADNMLYVRENNQDSDYSHSAIIRMVSEDSSKPVRTMKMHVVRPSEVTSNNQIVVEVPNVKSPIPFFILMRALGFISDKSIIEATLLDIEKNEDLVDVFIPSIHDASVSFSQTTSLQYIALLTKGKTTTHAMEILINYLLPQIGEMNFKQKGYFLGNMCMELIKVWKKQAKPTDRDSFQFKRIDLTGALIHDLFVEYYTLQQKEIFLNIDKKIYFRYKDVENIGSFKIEDIKTLIESNYPSIFKKRIVEDGFRRGYKGRWGSTSHTMKVGALQGVNRLSFNSFLSHLRKINLPFDASAKVIGPRLLHSSQWGYIDPIDTPDGGDVGLHKHMSIMSFVTNQYPKQKMVDWLFQNIFIYALEECKPNMLYNLTKIFVNGDWIGSVSNLFETISYMKNARRLSLIPIHTSVSHSIQRNSIYIFTDSGRLVRPIFYIDNEESSFINKQDNLSWNDMVHGIFDRTNYKEDGFYTTKELYKSFADDKFASLYNKRAIIDMIDTSEAESALIAASHNDLKKGHRYTHVEIHPSLLFGVMGHQVIFPENNPPTRNLFSCGQSKQAVSCYHSNYMNRVDKSGIVLNYGQIPLLKSRYYKYLHNEEMPYGENTIVAIMSYGGYNVEDAILVNKGAVDRGLFRTTYFSTYESNETTTDTNEHESESRFMNIQNESVKGRKPAYDYSEIGENGMIKEGTYVHDKMVVIGQVTVNEDGTYSDMSTGPKKGQLGYVDKCFMTNNDEGYRVAKVRVRDERIPNIGDKMASRAGQKGTIGLVIPEENMPFTAEGIKPDLIINPHAIPSRMTIGQLVECIIGKACTQLGSFGDCTAFTGNEETREMFGKVLQKENFHSQGNDILYDGMTGEQLESEIFIGPTYYMRLKHMVKDKINYRSLGPRQALTRQPLKGRANDGGLRIGEMERDGVIGHGASIFLSESMMKRGDEYYMAICNKSGTIAAYNPEQNIFYSPFVDGPVKFEGNVDDQKIQNISRFGRNFSIVRIPYSFKLLMHELQTMNIQMRIITQDNIDQLQSMSYSDNYYKLTNSRKPLQRFIMDALGENEEKKNRKRQDKMKKGEQDDMDTPVTPISTGSVPFAPDDPIDPNMAIYRGEPDSEQSSIYDPNKNYDDEGTPSVLNNIAETTKTIGDQISAFFTPSNEDKSIEPDDFAKEDENKVKVTQKDFTLKSNIADDDEETKSQEKEVTEDDVNADDEIEDVTDELPATTKEITIVKKG